MVILCRCMARDWEVEDGMRRLFGSGPTGKRGPHRAWRALACLGVAAALGVGGYAVSQPIVAWATQRSAEVTTGELVVQNKPINTRKGACAVDLYTAGPTKDGRQGYRAVFHPAGDGGGRTTRRGP